MTEEEAKTKWCPMAGASRFARQDEMCIASSCMAWRGRAKVIERRHAPLGQRPEDRHGNPEPGWRQVERGPGDYGLVYERTVSEAGGFCGLAGPPQ